MKKMFYLLLAVLTAAVLCTVCVSAWSDEEVEEGWTRHSIFEDDLVDLISAEGAHYPIPASYNNGYNDNSFQFWKDAEHLYQERGMNVFNGAQIVVYFKGTGFRLCTCYRNDHGFSVYDIGARLDGEDVSDRLVDLIAPTDNNTDHTPILEFTDLPAGEHYVTLTCYSSVYRFSVDYFEVLNEGAEAETEPETVPETAPAVTEAPGTDAPGTDVPGTDAPGTEAAGTAAPGPETAGSGDTETEKPAPKKGGAVGLILISVAAVAVVVVAVISISRDNRKYKN